MHEVGGPGARGGVPIGDEIEHVGPALPGLGAHHRERLQNVLVAHRLHLQDLLDGSLKQAGQTESPLEDRIHHWKTGFTTGRQDSS